MTEEGLTYADIFLLVAFCVSIPLCLSLVGLLVFHCNLIRLNRTTMERTSAHFTGKILET